MKIVLSGDSKTGKTTWVKSRLGIVHDGKMTLGVEVFLVGDNWIWDTAGNPQVGGLRGAYFIGADMVIVVGKNTKKYVQEARELCGDIPIHVFETVDEIDVL